ncbi:MAG: membrane protein insertion efficiency factor YidD [Christensenellaceae bacterium]|nr:membrane protein insertion efficiency factor YidD [Christensenellaceae bacterium]
MFTKFLLGLVSFYQKAISPHTIGACRFVPTCSEYMRIALERHGALKGLWLGIRRILRCHPFSSGGFDPVPEASETKIRRN